MARTSGFDDNDVSDGTGDRIDVVAPFADVEVDETAPPLTPHGPLIRPVTGRQIATGAALAVLMEGLGRTYLVRPHMGLVLGLAMLASLGIKRAIAAAYARTDRELPGLLWSEPLRLAADLALFLLLLIVFSAVLM